MGILYSIAKILLKTFFIVLAALMILLGANSAVSALIASRHIRNVPFDGAHYNLNGLRIFVRSFGEGSPLVILHDFSDSGLTHIQIAQKLSEDQRVFIVDLPGLGYSEFSSHYDFSIPGIADVIMELIDHFTTSQIDLLGHGAGGLIALKLAQEYPGSIRSVVAVNTPMTLDTPPLPEWLLSKRSLSELVLKHIYNTYLLEKSSAMRAYFNTDAFDAERFLMEYSLSYWVSPEITFDYYHMNKDYVPEGLETIRTPVLLIQGDRASDSSVEGANEMNITLRNSVLVIMENCGRYPMYENQPVFLNHIRSFLRSVR